MDCIADTTDRRLLDDWQRDLPLVPRPFAEIGAGLDIDEDEVLARLTRMYEAGRITRVGATCAPNTVSASTLAAMTVPESRIDEVAAIVGAEAGVNHSYLREHRWNLWFVATGPDRAHVTETLNRIAIRSRLRVLDLTLVRPFNVDLGFRMNGAPPGLPPVPRPVRPEVIVPGDRRLLQKLTTGLPLCPRPYAEIGASLGLDETAVIERVRALIGGGIIARLGVIVRHRALGWRANAMVVWDLPSDRIDAAGPVLAAHPGVTLCYERTPVPGVWPYRLYCMIHARSRAEAQATLAAATELPELKGVRHAVLFSSTCFKQTGALISTKTETAA